MEDNRLKDFLHELILNEEQYQEIHNRFCAEIRKGLSKKNNAIADTKCYITYVQDLPTGDELGKFLALDLGGSKFRVLLVELKGHHEASIDAVVYELPEKIITGPGTGLFDHIATCLEDFVKNKNLVGENLPLGFTFSFPCIQRGLTKATLVRWTKGFTSPGVVNQDVVRMLQEAIVRRGNLKIDVVAILNDTTGTLMACAHRNPQCRIGLIVGTGCNACYVEKIENCENLEESQRSKPYMIINIEWGAFGEHGALEFIRTDYDRQLDAKSPNKGTQLFEKMIAGMYLGELVRLIVLRAIRENLMFTTCAERRQLSDALQDHEHCFETERLSQIDADTAPNFEKTKSILLLLFQLKDPSQEDCAKLKFICEVVAKRAGNMIGCALSGLINRINDPKAVVAVDGSVYKFHPSFDTYMRETMNKFVSSKLKYDIMLSEDGSGRGAALVAAVVSKAKTAANNNNNNTDKTNN